jgi:hypothetical protein
MRIEYFAQTRYDDLMSLAAMKRWRYTTAGGCRASHPDNRGLIFICRYGI